VEDGPRPLVHPKLRNGETDESVMIFEEVAPVGTVTPMHLHHDSDEVAYVLSGEITLKIGDAVTVGGPGTCAFMRRDVAHAWKSTGTETGRVLFMYTQEGPESCSRRWWKGRWTR
jgi:quercetin dioxygenase-like cupin family protein